jgi:leucyl-tRNA synthetase
MEQLLENRGSTDAGSSSYEPATVEDRWQAAWRELDAFAVPAVEDGATPAYVYGAPPFPSGQLHLGHVRSYTLGDVCARFLRARGTHVLFSMGFDAFGLPAEIAAGNAGVSPKAWVERCCEEMRRSFEELGISFDWTRQFVSSDPDFYRWTQELFLRLLERGLLYRRDGYVLWCDSCTTTLAKTQIEAGSCWRCDTPARTVKREQWYFSLEAFLDEKSVNLPRVSGRWNRRAVKAQEEVLGRVDGVELSSRLCGEASRCFTPHADHLELATFVAVSPDAMPPALDRLVEEDERIGLRASWGSGDEARGGALLVRSARAEVDGLGSLPLVVTPLVDARFGPTVALGIPAIDRTDEAIAVQLGLPTRPAPRSGREPSPRRTVRFRAADFPISRQRAWGAPIPVVRCRACGDVPARRQDLPVTLPDDLRVGAAGDVLARHPQFRRCKCPRCGSPAERETDTLDGHVDSFWMWMALCVPPEERGAAMFEHPEVRRWSPIAHLVWGADTGQYMLDQRIVASVLGETGALAHLEDGEPYASVLMHGMVKSAGVKISKRLGNGVDTAALVASYGADAIRLAVLLAAAPSNSFNWNEDQVRFTRRFLDRLWRFAEPRLVANRDEARDTPSPPTGRLGRSCAIAQGRVTRNLEDKAFHLAVRNVIAFLDSIEALERRAERGGAAPEELRGPTRAALLLLVRLLAPLAPHICEELWARGGSPVPLCLSAWPEKDAVQ